MAIAQDSAGSDWARPAGGALGLYSGSVLGLSGSLIPCSQTLAGLTCVRVSTAAGGAVGLASGIYIGDADEEAVERIARGAGWGLLGGAVAGSVLALVVPHYGPLDVLTLGAIGIALGASAPGAAIGFGAGVVIGSVLWQLIPSFELADAVGTATVGMAVGGLATWVVRAVDAQSDGAGPEVVVPFSIKI